MARITVKKINVITSGLKHDCETLIYKLSLANCLNNEIQIFIDL